MSDDVGRGRFGAVGDEDSLLSHVELAVGVVSSILRDSDLKKVDALSIEEALAFTLQGTAFDEEVEEFDSEAEAVEGAEVLSGASDRDPFPDDLRIPLKASSLALPVGALPFNPPASMNRGPTLGA